MSNQIRILKADDVARHAVVTLPTPEGGRPPGAEAVSAVAPDLDVIVEQARAEGAADAGRALESSLRQLATALEGLAAEGAAARFAALRADSDAVIETALLVCRWILDRELAQPDAVIDLAQRALADTGDAVATRLRVHPELAECLVEISPDEVIVLADASLAPGEFVTETTGPDIAFRFEEALDRARQALQRERAAT